MTSAPTSYAAAVVPTLTLGNAPGDAGILTAHVVSDHAVTSVTAHLTSYADPQHTADAVLHLTSGSTTNGTWSTDRVNLGDLGLYTFQATARDTDGDVGTASEQLNYSPLPFADSVAFTPGTLDLSHPALHASGTILLRDPRDASTSPDTGEYLYVGTDNGSALAQTAADGSFAADFTPRPADRLTDGGQLQVRVQDSGGAVLASTVASTRLTPTRVTFDPAPTGLHFGDSYQVTGSVEYEDGSTWKPLGGANLSDDKSDDSTPLATSGADGRFTIGWSVYNAAQVISVYLVRDHMAAGAYYLQGHGSVTVYAKDETTLTWVNQPRINQLSELHLYADLFSDNVSVKAGLKVYLEHSADGQTGWTSLGYLLTDKYGGIREDVYVDNPHGYWRLSFRGTSSLLPSSTTSGHAWKHESRIIHFNAGPEPVRKGRTITVSGQVQRDPGTGYEPVSKKWVYYFFRAKGKTKYVSLGRSRSSARGNFTMRFTASKDGRWLAAWYPIKTTYLNAYSRSDYVNVTG